AQRIDLDARVDKADGGFGSLLSKTVNGVNESMLNAQAKTEAFIREEPGASLVDAMVAMNQAQVSFRYAVEVRNRLIQAYQDIANMPV
ncbi:MAG: flagellar hook-basal body complex protein FliE, partial [Gammaproteobacteria bacterium]|nr:flagellar hook-basal body complex protein FliE [Gammaproteobacteria bacterium]